MYLKRLELRGFKTFASYTDFLFDAGITAIVGPNGSGKSNIADAVRWVLGEQSYSALRGKRTEDMIFAGTHRRPQLGMAEAILTFDNTSHWLPIDYSEVTVSRRAYRSGENQYLINASRVRLRDVLDLLGKAGLGRQGFVVLGQGLVDAALSLRPDERRVLFEEAAGIHIYRDKRNEALSRLAETQQNLVRVNDILNEIAPRLQDLERQAKRAEERTLLQRDMEQVLRVWYGYHWQRVGARLAESEAALQRRLEDVNLGRAKLHELEALISDTQSRQGEQRRQLSAWHKASGEQHGSAEATARELAVSRERLGLLQGRAVELQSEVEQVRSRQVSLQESVHAASAEGQRLRQEADERRAALEEARVRWQHAEGERVTLESDIESARDKAFRLATTLAEAHNRHRQLQERRSQLSAEREKRRGEWASVQQQASQLAESVAGAERQMEELQATMEASLRRQKELQGTLNALEEAQRQRRDELDEVLRQRQRAEDRRDLLQGLRQNLAGFAPGVKALLEAKDRLPGIVGPVASLVRAPKQYERAVEAALGAHAQALVVAGWDQASAAIERLRRTGAGSATFLPLDSLTAPEAGPALSGEGVLGAAASLVEYEPRYHTAVSLLLGQVMVVQDLPTARRVRPRLAPGQRLVTLSGEVVLASGVITGGAARGGGGLLAQEREWRELPAQLAELGRTHEAATAALAQAEDACRSAQQQVSAATDEFSRLTKERDALQRTLDAESQKLDRLRQEDGWRQQLDEQVAQELANLQEQAVAIQGETDACARDHETSKTGLEELLGRLQMARQEEEQARATLAEGETELAVLEQQAKLQEEMLAAQMADIEKMEQEIAARTERATETEAKTTALAARVSVLQGRADELSAQIAQLAAQIEPAEAEVLSLDEQLVRLEKALSYGRQRLTELDALHSQQVLETERRRDALASMEQRIEDDLGDIEYPAERVQQLRLEFLGEQRPVLAPMTVLPESLGGEIKDLKARLRRLGSVNPNAPQEYHEVRERHDFLRSQTSDLEGSSASLQQVIKELDRVMEKEFLSVFQVAAEHFPRYFEALFGGGAAKLELTEPDELSTTGVEVLARPPGRRHQSLALLSGGERALTATALLFAVLKAKPLPFCLLDEVDAMLDEANVGRFRALLEEFAQQTQFIVITHNRRTIEAANTIYGVSMGEEGVSRVISLRLEEAKRVASR